jgi:hypothetical protein
MGGKSPIPATVDEARRRASSEIRGIVGITTEQNDAKFWSVIGRLRRAGHTYVNVDRFYRTTIVPTGDLPDFLQTLSMRGAVPPLPHDNPQRGLQT